MADPFDCLQYHIETCLDLKSHVAIVRILAKTPDQKIGLSPAAQGLSEAFLAYSTA